jgi:hypothetical protein
MNVSRKILAVAGAAPSGLDDRLEASAGSLSYITFRMVRALSQGCPEASFTH